MVKKGSFKHLFIGSARQTAYSKALDVKKGEKLVVQLNLNDKMLVGNT
jgi:hypothetical protein